MSWLKRTFGRKESLRLPLEADEKHFKQGSGFRDLFYAALNKTQLKLDETLDKTVDEEADRGRTSFRFETLVGTLLADSEYERNRLLGDIGEMATALIVTGKGYRQFPSQNSNNHGLDGVFVKFGKDSGTGKIYPKSILVTETKTGPNGIINYNSKAPPILHDDSIRNRLKYLQQSRSQAADVAAFIEKAMKESYPPIEKQLWVHDLKTGTTKVCYANGVGTLEGCEVEKSHDGIIEALLFNLSISRFVGIELKAEYQSDYADGED